MKLVLQDGAQRLQYAVELSALLGLFLRLGRFGVFVFVEAFGFGASRHAVEDGEQGVARDLLRLILIVGGGEEVQDDGEMVGSSVSEKTKPSAA